MDNTDIGQTFNIKDIETETLKQNYSEMYDKIHIEIMNYLGENFDLSYAESATHAEALTELVEQEVEEEILEAE